MGFAPVAHPWFRVAPKQIFGIEGRGPTSALVATMVSAQFGFTEHILPAQTFRWVLGLC